ncbi:TPA: C40 family peptidase [Klebsiella aerogenes]|nr:C40 family peptidase [Klebsiella aerogenes]
MNLTKGTIEAIFKQGRAEYPREACGLVVMAGRKQLYIACANVAANPLEHFEIAPQDYAAAEERGIVTACVHTHCGDGATTQPSAADIAGCNESGLTWVIASLPEGDVRELQPEEPPLVGRAFALGSYDCWGLIMAWHKQQGIELYDWRKPYAWWEQGENLYAENWYGEGFREVDEPRPGDMVMMQVSADVVNHGGILLENNMLLHHLYGQLSAVTPYGGYWRDRTFKIVRHKDLP